ncbi:MAG: hypothetical protein RL701_6210 [Pseudomonadota bacterium]
MRCHLCSAYLPMSQTSSTKLVAVPTRLVLQLVKTTGALLRMRPRWTSPLRSHRQGGPRSNERLRNSGAERRTHMRSRAESNHRTSCATRTALFLKSPTSLSSGKDSPLLDPKAVRALLELLRPLYTSTSAWPASLKRADSADSQALRASPRALVACVGPASRLESGPPRQELQRPEPLNCSPIGGHSRFVPVVSPCYEQFGLRLVPATAPTLSGRPVSNCLESLEPPSRFELETYGLRNRCSTTELRWQKRINPNSYDAGRNEIPRYIRYVR